MDMMLRNGNHRFSISLSSAIIALLELEIALIISASPTSELAAPHSVRVEARAEQSFTLSWRLDATRTNSLNRETSLGDVQTPVAFAVHYAENGSSDAEQKALVSATSTSRLVSGLKPNTNYSVRVVAMYQNGKSSSSEKFLVQTLATGSSNGASVESGNEVCDCDTTGSLHCLKNLPQSLIGASGASADEANQRCMCREGYLGEKCEFCADGFYRASSNNSCLPCSPSCSNLTSIGSCRIATSETEDTLECDCMPGHMGFRCDICSRGFLWLEGRCVPCGCLRCASFNHAHQEEVASHESSEEEEEDVVEGEGEEGARHSHLLDRRSRLCIDYCPEISPNATVTLSAVQLACGTPWLGSRRTIMGHDGAVAIVAVFCSLLFIAAVAGGVTCYRRWSDNDIRLRRARNPWTVERSEEKTCLNPSDCDYQRLDAANNRRNNELSGSKQQQQPGSDEVAIVGDQQHPRDQKNKSKAAGCEPGGRKSKERKKREAISGDDTDKVVAGENA